MENSDKGNSEVEQSHSTTLDSLTQTYEEKFNGKCEDQAALRFLPVLKLSTPENDHNCEAIVLSDQLKLYKVDSLKHY